MNVTFLDTAIGRLGIAERGGAVTNLFFAADALPPDAREGRSALLDEAARQVRAYLAGELRAFGLPLAPAGTPFMRAVWELLVTIPYGSTASYGEVAALAGNPRAARAVGLANNRNPIPLMIPCHRVVGARGALTGFRGGLAAKKYLLELERGNAPR